MWLKWTAVLVACVVGAISLMASMGVGTPILRSLKSAAGGDTMAHFLLIGSMSFAVTLGFVGMERPNRLKQTCRVVFVLAALVTLDEFLQLFLPRRTFSISDLLANYSGIVVFSIAGLLVIRFMTPAENSERISAKREAACSGSVDEDDV